MLITAFLVSSCITNSDNEILEHDPHYTSAGFFDLHICNWPGQPLIFLAVFSTLDYEKIESVTVFRPDNSKVGAFNLESFKVKKLKNNRNKQIYLARFATNSNEQDGWYKAVIQLTGGETIIAKDYINIKKMPAAKNITPASSLDIIQIPTALSWQEIPEAGYYKITIRDMWEGGKVIHSSPLLPHNEYSLPKGLIKSGGWYTWVVHARDVNEDLLLGDFNHGSLTSSLVFLTVD